MKLTLKAKANNWDLFRRRKKSAKFKKVYAMIMRRDRYICQFCHYESPQMEIVNADNDYKHNTKENFICSCSLCAKCTLLDAYDLDYEGEDKIIYLPELTQEELNHLVRSLFCKVTSENTDSVYNAKKLLAQLQDRAKWLDDKVGCELSHPGLFAYYMTGKDANVKLVTKLRWLPDIEGFREEIPHWKEALTLS